ncbi:MAG: preprotein translocase subunit SecA [Parcubacteria group bacterium]|nr:preprotein translocase subunit SecA [Parcubacteria group bacterium]
MSILGKILGDADERVVASMRPLVEEINGEETALKDLSLAQLAERFSQLRERVQKGPPTGEAGETLNDVLPECFALVREAALRTLSQRHFDVQLMGGIALHRGKIAEMKTGEGKTLVATLATALNALEGKGVHVVTVNDYLARRDAAWMGQIYHALGLSVGCIVHDTSYIYDPSFAKASEGEPIDKERDAVGGFKIVEKFLRPVSRKDAYAADITYGTNNEFGFDYLKDNMVYDLAHMVQRGHNFAIVDEVDSILIDEARTPLIISAPDTQSSSWYKDFARLIPKLKAETDYEIDEKRKAVTLTEHGIDHVQELIGAGDIYQEKGIKYLHHLEQALRAEAMFQRDRDYVVKDGQLVIVDEFTGRLLPGRRYSGGLHQALEAKENVFVQPESLTLASITFQNYFRMYKKLAGMTGTALTSAEEFHKVYNIDVLSIPTNKPLVRQDLRDLVYKTEEEKFNAVVREVKERHLKGQPMLVGTASIQRNERLSQLLSRDGVPHEVLNAKNHEREGAIIAQAGRKGAVTIATNMAGRGVDIVLGGNPQVLKEAEQCRSLGGLYVIGTERHEARRIDNQLRGRSGRQGDPGSSQFFVSLEDDLMRIFGGDKLKGIMEKFHLPEGEPIQHAMVSKAIESAQGKVEGFNFDARKHLLEYDDVLNRHRETMYRKRNEMLEQQDPAQLRSKIMAITQKAGHTQEEYEKKEQEVGEENMRQAERIIPLRVIDSSWVEHLENMEQLRDSVRLRAYGQQDPLVEYKNEGHKMFQGLLQIIDALIAETIMNMKLASTSVPSTSLGASEGKPVQSMPKVGRNDPCPCGSGKKYKRCHGQ